MTQAQVDLKRKRDAAMRKKPTHQKKPMLEEALLPRQQPQQREIQMEIRTETPPPLAMVTPTITAPTILTDDGRVADPDISEALLDFDDYVQRVTTLEDSFRADDDIRTQPEYHLRMFKDDSTDPNAMATSELPKIPTTKERVLGILTNPIRQVKKAIDRREIFMIAYICTKDLNQRIALDTLHLSARTRKLVQLLWLTLPASYTNYIHHESTITQFSPRGSTCQRKYSIIKDYFDVNENLVTICRNVRANLDLIRYIYSNVHAEVFYASDEGLGIERKVKELLMQHDMLLTDPRWQQRSLPPLPTPISVGQMVHQQRNIAEASRTAGDYLPYGVTKR